MQQKDNFNALQNKVKISAVTETKKGRFALFTQQNGEKEFLFSVDGETLVKYHIEEGSLLSGEELRFVKQQSDTRKAKDKALDYIGRRDYAENELYNKLCQKFDEHSAANAVQWLKGLNLLNDQGFAMHRAAYLFKNGKSKLQVTAALAALGIDKQIISSAITACMPDTVAQITQIIEKSYKSKLAAGKKQNVLAALARRGFAYNDIKDALCAVIEKYGYDNAENAHDDCY